MDKSILFWWNPVHKPEDAHDSLPFLKLAALWSCKLSKGISMYVLRNPILNFFRPPPLFAYCQYWKWIKIALFWPFIYEINQSLKKKKISESNNHIFFLDKINFKTGKTLSTLGFQLQICAYLTRYSITILLL